jgi:hypothetical protein
MQLNTPQDGRISIDATKPFVDEQQVEPGEQQTPAYTITGPNNYVIGIEEGTPVAAEFRAQTGEKLDDSTRVVIQKCDRQGNPLGSEIVFSELLGRFDYSEMRTDPDYFRRTSTDLMIDEHEIVKVFVQIPERAEQALSPAQSVLTIGDATSDFGKPVEIVHHSELSSQQLAAVKSASQASSSSNSAMQSGMGGGS